MIRPGLYSQKPLFIATLFGGPAIAAFIIAMNLWAKEKKLLAIIPVRIGSVSEIMEIDIRFG
jgi:hypothetical protein